MLARKSHVLCMTTHVNTQLATLAERFTTQFTQVAFAASVTVHVCLQRSCLEEAHLADVAPNKTEMRATLNLK